MSRKKNRRSRASKGRSTNSVVASSKMPQQVSSQVRPKNAEEIKKQIRLRLWGILDYVTIILFSVVVYATAAIGEYLLFSLLWWLLGEEMRKYPFVALVAQFVQVGLALMGLAAAFTHGCSSTIGQIRFDIHNLRGGEDQ